MRVRQSYECSPYQCCPADTTPPERINAWTTKGGEVVWSCVHNRPFSQCADGDWEPHLSRREVSDRKFNERANEVREAAMRGEQ